MICRTDRQTDRPDQKTPQTQHATRPSIPTTTTTRTMPAAMTATASAAAARKSSAIAPEKKYKCQFCNRAFSRSEHRSRHERSRKLSSLVFFLLLMCACLPASFPTFAFPSLQARVAYPTPRHHTIINPITTFSPLHPSSCIMSLFWSHPANQLLLL